MSKKKKAYAQAGVDIDLAEKLLDQVKPALKKAVRPESLGSIGGFGGFFDISKIKLKHPILVSSTDSVGTKVSVARMAGDYSNLGADIVNHCSNDVAVCGAEPLYFLDYYATTRLDKHYASLLKGLAKACVAGNLALVGGETAELPGVYAEGECDLVGTIVGAVDKKLILTGEAIRPGDVVIGLPSSGLHTNGFSLARKIFFENLGIKVSDILPGSRSTLGKALLKPHVNYAPFLVHALKKFNRGDVAARRKDNAIFGAAHITGGGFTGNIPRILPGNCEVEIETESWTPLPVFKALRDSGMVEFEELYEVFNMGMGLTIIVQQEAAGDIIKEAWKFGHKANVIGRVFSGAGKVQLS